MYVILRYPRNSYRLEAVPSSLKFEAQVASKSQFFDVKSRVITGKSQASRKSAKHLLESDSSLESRTLTINNNFESAIRSRTMYS